MTKFNNYLLYLFYPLLLILGYLQARAILPPYYVPLTGNLMIPFSIVVRVYFFYTLVTIISYSFNGRPIMLYFQEMAYVSPTMLIAFVAADKSIDNKGKFYKILFVSWLICFTIGFYLYFFRPDWYTTAITLKHAATSWKNQMLSDDQILEQFRFGSFLLDSYAVSFLSMFLFPMSVCYFSRANRDKKRLLFLTIIIIAISALLSMQRIAIVCLIVDVILLYILGEKEIKKSMSYILILIIGLFLVFGGYLIATEEIWEKVLNAFSSDNLDDAINGSRLYQIKTVFNQLDNPITGQGIGSLGGRARELGLAGISDCCWVKIFCEQGIIGFVMFCALMIKTLKRAFKNKTFYYVEICAIINIMIAMMVSDPLFYQKYVLPFWFMIGRVWNNTYLERVKLKNCKLNRI